MMGDSKHESSSSTSSLTTASTVTGSPATKLDLPNDENQWIRKPPVDVLLDERPTDMDSVISELSAT